MRTLALEPSKYLFAVDSANCVGDSKRTAEFGGE